MAQRFLYGDNYIELSPPREWMDTGIDSTINDDLVKSNINTNIFSFVGTAAVFLKDWRTNNGVFNGCPFRIEYSSNLDPTQNRVVFDGYIDLASPETFINSTLNPTIIKAPVVPITDNNSVMDHMLVITQRLLINKGFLVNSDYVDVPVIIESKKNVRERAMIIAQFGAQVVTSMTQIVSNFIGALGNVASLGVIFGAIELALVFVSAVLVIKRLFDVGISIKDNFFGPIRYYKAASFKTILTKAFAYKGYTLNLGILDDLYSKTYLIASQNGFGGYPVQGIPATGSLKPQDFGYTIGEMLDALTEWTYNRHRIIGDEVNFRARKDPFWFTSPDYQPDNVMIKSVDQYQNAQYQDDAERVKATVMINYQYDTSDAHTLTEKLGDSIEIHRDLINELDPKMVTLKGIDEVQIPWAMCVRKQPFDSLWDQLAEVFGGYDVFLQEIKDRITQFLGDLNASGVDLVAQITDIFAQSNLGSLISDRAGALKIDDDAYAIPKVVYLTNTSKGKRIPANFKDFIGAPALYNTWRKWDSPADVSDFAGQYRLVDGLRIKFSYEDSDLVNDNPYFELGGIPAKFTFINWKESDHEAQVNIELNEPFDTNITEEEIND